MRVSLARRTSSEMPTSLAPEFPRPIRPRFVHRESRSHVAVLRRASAAFLDRVQARGRQTALAENRRGASSRHGYTARFTDGPRPNADVAIRPPPQSAC